LALAGGWLRFPGNLISFSWPHAPFCVAKEELRLPPLGSGGRTRRNCEQSSKVHRTFTELFSSGLSL